MTSHGNFEVSDFGDTFDLYDGIIEFEPPDQRGFILLELTEYEDNEDFTGEQIARVIISMNQYSMLYNFISPDMTTVIEVRGKLIEMNLIEA